MPINHPYDEVLSHEDWNFPGQFKHLAPALVAQGHEVRALTLQQNVPESWLGVILQGYAVSRASSPTIHPWLIDLEAKVIRGEAAFHVALQMKRDGFTPEVIIAHPGWGESLFLKDVWPAAQLGIYCEFFYHAHGADVGFDPEFPLVEPAIAAKMRIENANTLLHSDLADAGLSPTHWQASTFPEPLREKIRVIHDGIDTDALAPNPNISLTLNNTLMASALGQHIPQRHDALKIPVYIHRLTPRACKQAGKPVYSRLLGERNACDEGSMPGGLPERNR